jgi:hypothetical protein
LSDAFFSEEGNNTLDYGTGILHGVEVENENGVVTENNEEVIFFYHEIDPCRKMKSFGGLSKKKTMEDYCIHSNHKIQP